MQWPILTIGNVNLNRHRRTFLKALAACPLCAALKVEAQESRHWTYEGDAGSEKWGELDSAYLGRISDLGRDGHTELIRMQRCVDGLASPLRLLVASLRQPDDLARLAAEGLNTFTISPPIAEALFSCGATEAAAAQFERDASSP